MRITNSMMTNNVLYNIQKSLSKMDKYSNQLSTGKKYVLAEDDPINTVLGMHFRTKITESEQFIRNIEDGVEWLDTCDTALGHVVDLLREVRTKTVYGANDHLGPEDRDAIATEVNEYLNGILDTANTEFKGDFIFGGSNTRTAPFAAFRGEDNGESPNVTSYDYMNPESEDRVNINMKNITRIKYQGNSTSINRQLQQSLDITINDTGNNIFSAETHSVTAGTMLVRDQNVPLNDVSNFNGGIELPNPVPVHPDAAPESTSFTVGLKGEKMATISYNADEDSIIDIADKINEKALGVKAVVKKEVVDNVDYFKLEISAEDSGKEIVMFDSNKASQKTTAVPQFINPDTDDFTVFNGGANTAVGEVHINGKQFVMSDYGTIRQFMNDVVNDPDANISEFTYDSVNGTFSIKADEGYALDIKEKGDVNDVGAVGNMGFFSGLGISTRGNLLKEMGVFNEIESGITMNSKNAYLNNIPNMKEGSVIVNGAIINIDPDSDTLSTLAKKINNADVGVRATVEEDVNTPGNFRLVLNSEHPGKMDLQNREGDIFSTMGFIDKYTGNYNGYPSKIDDPQDIGMFSVVMDIRDNLYKNDNEALEENLGKLDEIIDNILEYRSKIGARVLAAETSQSKLEDVKINTTNLMSSVEDVDIAEVIMKMKMQENVQNAALQTGASIIQRSLIDFLG